MKSESGAERTDGIEGRRAGQRTAATGHARTSSGLSNGRNMAAERIVGPAVAAGVSGARAHAHVPAAQQRARIRLAVAEAAQGDALAQVVGAVPSGADVHVRDGVGLLLRGEDDLVEDPVEGAVSAERGARADGAVEPAPLGEHRSRLELAPGLALLALLAFGGDRVPGQQRDHHGHQHHQNQRSAHPGTPFSHKMLVR